MHVFKKRRPFAQRQCAGLKDLIRAVETCLEQSFAHRFKSRAWPGSRLIQSFNEIAHRKSFFEVRGGIRRKSFRQSRLVAEILLWTGVFVAYFMSKWLIEKFSAALKSGINQFLFNANISHRREP